MYHPDVTGGDGLAPWEFEFPFPGSLTTTFLVQQAKVYHPDATGGDEASTEVFLIVNEAYEVTTLI